METLRSSGWLILILVSIVIGFPLTFDALPPLFYLLIVLTLFLLLMKWGPEMSVNRPIHWISMLGLAAIVTSLLNESAINNNIYGSFVFWLAILLVLLVFVAVAKSSPKGPWGHRLQTTTIAALIAFGLMANLASHIAQADTSTGAYWVLDVPFFSFIRFPRPYDYYLIRTSLPIVALSSLVCGLGLALIYFVVNRRSPQLKPGRMESA